MPRRKYHSAVKISFALRVQKVLPIAILQEIPKSTSSKWRHMCEADFFGYEYAHLLSKDLKDIELIYDQKHKIERRIFCAYLRLKVMIMGLLNRNNLKRAFRDNKEKVIDTIHAIKETIPTSLACRLLNISIKTYHHWICQIRYKCHHSPISLCLKKTPGQISLKQLLPFKELLSDQKYQHWPIASVWAYAIRQGKIAFSLATAYRYNELLKIRSRKKKYKKVFNAPVATAPDQYWHADVTIYKTRDGVKHYIYLLIDRFSKKILSWNVSTTMSASIRLLSIKKAIEDLTPAHKDRSIDLIVDGGSENNNHIIEDFIKNTQVNLHKKIALKDVPFSNSCIEAFNKVIKYDWLFPQQPTDEDDLNKVLENSIHEYNSIRPHYAHKVYTPDEMYYGQNSSFDLKAYLKEAKGARKIENLDQICYDC